MDEFFMNSWKSQTRTEAGSRREGRLPGSCCSRFGLRNEEGCLQQGGARAGGARALPICVQAKASLATNPGLLDRERVAHTETLPSATPRF